MEKMSGMIVQKAIEISQNAGFTYVKPLAEAKIPVRDEVREMCRADRCGMYGKNWSCPPACGDLAECRNQLDKYSCGVLVQTVGDVEDSWDYETMMEIEAQHKERFRKTAKCLKELFSDMLSLGTGCCTICDKCTYPEQNCRFPKTRISSLEAYGILVSDLCMQNDLRYYYGSKKIAYTSCFLFVDHMQ